MQSEYVGFLVVNFLFYNLVRNNLEYEVRENERDGNFHCTMQGSKLLSITDLSKNTQNLSVCCL
jgi:hypothetical protein